MIVGYYDMTTYRECIGLFQIAIFVKNLTLGRKFVILSFNDNQLTHTCGLIFFHLISDTFNNILETYLT